MNKKLLITGLFLYSSICLSEDVNINKVIQIESTGHPLAYHKVSHARGLMQITPICLEEWNNFHRNEQYSEIELFIPEINRRIGTWYIENRIPAMLKSYRIEDTIENRLIAYNWGAKKLKSYLNGGIKLRKQSKEYVEKYNQ